MMLTGLEKKTLLLLATSEPLTGYDIHSKKKGGGSNEPAETVIMSNAHWEKVKKKLIQLRFIEKLPQEGRRIPYKLSEDGFDHIIRLYINDILEFDKFATKCSEYFPLVFGYWELLKKHNLEEHVKRVLNRGVKHIYLRVIDELYRGIRMRYSHEEFINDLSMLIYGPFIYDYTIEEIKREIPIEGIKHFLNENSEVKNFCIKRSQELDARLHSGFEILEWYNENVLYTNEH